MIWGTAFFGGYCFMRGLSSIIEPDFMTEMELATKLYNDQPIVFDETYLFYFIIFVFFFAFSVVWQYMLNAMIKKENEKWDG